MIFNHSMLSVAVFDLCQLYFRFDHAYWSVDAKDPGFAGQDVVWLDAEKNNFSNTY
jgi:hypothetical protein